MTIDPHVWPGSLPLIRQRGDQWVALHFHPDFSTFFWYLHPLFRLLRTQVASSNSSICPSDLRALTAAAGLKGDTVVSHCWQMRTGNPRIEPDNGLGNWQAVDRTGCTTHQMLLIIHKSMSRLQHSVTHFTCLRQKKKKIGVRFRVQHSPENFCLFVTN